jgi:predicted Fe-S protein YdhL (DUF1289 family)
MLPDRDVCAGCYRTLEEIALWSRFAEPERAEVMALLPARRKEIEASSA